MNWYYVRDGKQDGPHSDESLRELARSGVIDSATLVWSEGMENWQAISQAAPHLLPAAGLRLAATSGTTEAQCSECGGVFPASEMVSLQGSQICARCKPVRLQKMREGVATNTREAELARLLKVAKATKQLREAGFKVGLLGRNPKDVERRMTGG